MQELVDGTCEGVVGELDRRTIVAEIHGHCLSLQGIGLTLKEGVGVFEDDDDEFLFVFGWGDGFDASDLCPGNIPGGQTAGIIGKAGIIDDDTGTILYYLPEIEGAEQEADEEDKGADDDHDHREGQEDTGFMRLEDDEEKAQQDTTDREQEKLCQFAFAELDNSFVGRHEGDDLLARTQDSQFA